MDLIADIAMKFFNACETGKGWDACKAYCSPDATFSCQADALADVKTLEHYTKWMKGTFNLMPSSLSESLSYFGRLRCRFLGRRCG